MSTKLFVPHSLAEGPTSVQQAYVARLGAFLRKTERIHMTHVGDYFLPETSERHTSSSKESTTQQIGGDDDRLSWEEIVSLTREVAAALTPELCEMQALVPHSGSSAEPSGAERSILDRLQEHSSAFRQEALALRLDRAPMNPDELPAGILGEDCSSSAAAAAAAAAAPSGSPTDADELFEKLTNFGMSVKKQHEVHRMRNMIGHVIDTANRRNRGNNASEDDVSQKINTVINVGEGKGYVSRCLSICDGHQVVGIDCNPCHQEGSFDRLEKMLSQSVALGSGGGSGPSQQKQISKAKKGEMTKEKVEAMAAAKRKKNTNGTDNESLPEKQSRNEEQATATEGATSADHKAPAVNAVPSSSTSAAAPNLNANNIIYRDRGFMCSVTAMINKQSDLAEIIEKDPQMKKEVAVEGGDALVDGMKKDAVQMVERKAKCKLCGAVVRFTRAAPLVKHLERNHCCSATPSSAAANATDDKNSSPADTTTISKEAIAAMRARLGGSHNVAEDETLLDELLNAYYMPLEDASAGGGGDAEVGSSASDRLSRGVCCKVKLLWEPPAKHKKETVPLGKESVAADVENDDVTSSSITFPQNAGEVFHVTVLGHDGSSKSVKVLDHRSNAKIMVRLLLPTPNGTQQEQEENEQLQRQEDGSAPLGLTSEEKTLAGESLAAHTTPRPMLLILDVMRPGEVIRYPLAPNLSNTLMIGLHTCGDLGSNICRIFLRSQAPALLLVSCCWHALTPDGYPLSQFALSLNEGHSVNTSKLSMMLATQPLDMWGAQTTQQHLDSQKLLYYRALLPLVFKECGTRTTDENNRHLFELKPAFLRGIAKRKSELTLGELACLVRDEYLQPPASDAIGCVCNATNAELHAAAEKMEASHDFLEFAAFGVLRMWLAPLMEAFLLCDRALFVAEGLTSEGGAVDRHPDRPPPVVALIPLFDGAISPRMYGIIALR